jgi:hypothetical protein
MKGAIWVIPTHEEDHREEERRGHEDREQKQPSWIRNTA